MIEVKDLRAILLERGLPEEEIERFLEKNAREDAHMDAMICIKCGAAITRQVDPRQSGVTLTETSTWVNYRCTKCSWMMDRAEVLAPS